VTPKDGAMDTAAEDSFDDGELEELVLACLDATDPRAELHLRAAHRPALAAAAERLIGQVSRLEQLDTTALIGAPEPRADDPRSWPTIPGVELVALIGRGGQGLVFRGTQRYLQRTVAVKLLAPDLQTPAFVERFRREARMLAALQHPHIVTCHDAGVTPSGQCYLVMELVDGPNLGRWLDDHGPLDVSTALELVRDLALALEHAQRDGLVHRDVKPENVLLQPRSVKGVAFPFVAKLVDLGLARPVQRTAGFTLLTPVGSVVGTPATMAPEQFDAPESVDHRADIYGLGCVLFHALAGQPAFTGTAMTEVLLQKLALRDAGGRVTLDGVPDDVTSLVSRMLAWDASARPASYAELRADLEALTRGASAHFAPPTSKTLPRVLTIAATAALVLAAWRLVDRAPRESRPLGVTERAPLETAVEGSAHVAAKESSVTTAMPKLGTPQQLFPTETELPLAAWECDTPRNWGVDELGVGVLVNTSRGRTAARRALPPGAFELRGELEPRPRFESTTNTPVPIDALGLRIELAGDDALALELTPLGGTRFAATWRRERREGSEWRVVADLDGCADEFPLAEPLAFSVTWSGSRLEAHCGPRDTPSAALVSASPGSDWGNPGAPEALEVYAERGVAVLTGWTLAVAE
jgi:serine/threonine protein kinase